MMDRDNVYAIGEATAKSTGVWRSALIEVLLEWVVSNESGSEMVRDIIARDGNRSLDAFPGALLEYNATRVVPAINQRLANVGSAYRIAPVNAATGLEVMRLNIQH